MRLKFKMLTIKQDMSQIRCEDCFFYDISERRLFPCIHSSSTPEVAKVCFRGQSIPMSCFSVRPSTLTPHFHKVCGCCSGSPATPCHPHTELHRWLVDSSSIRAVSSSASRCLGVKAKRKEKCTSSNTEDHLSGRCVGFDHDAGTSVSCLNRVERRPVTHCEAFSEAVGSDGSYVQRGLLHMRPLQWWLRTTGFSPKGNLFRMIKVARQCLRVLDMWKKPGFCSQGPILGAPCCHVTLTMDASLMGWGKVPISCGTSIAWRCWQYFKLWNTFSQTWKAIMC